MEVVLKGLLLMRICVPQCTNFFQYSWKGRGYDYSKWKHGSLKGRFALNGVVT